MPKKSHKKLLRKGKRSGKKSQKGGTDVNEEYNQMKQGGTIPKRLPNWSPNDEPEDDADDAAQRDIDRHRAQEAIVQLKKELERIKNSTDPVKDDYLVIKQSASDNNYQSNFFKIINAYLKQGWVLQGGVNVSDTQMSQALKGPA